MTYLALNTCCSILGVDEWPARAVHEPSSTADVQVTVEPRRQYDVIACLNVLDRSLLRVFFPLCHVV